MNKLIRLLKRRNKKGKEKAKKNNKYPNYFVKKIHIFILSDKFFLLDGQNAKIVRLFY
jgi:hypothetical protein